MKITAAPIDGAANIQSIKYLSSFFKVPKSTIEITRGTHSKEKWIWFKTVSPAELSEVMASQ